MKQATRISPKPMAFKASIPLTVLLLDDDAFDRMHLQRLVKKISRPIDVVSCSTLEEFDRELARKTADICIVDHGLHNGSGLDAIKALKTAQGMSHVPVVMISGREDIKTVVESMKAGCVDYINKDNLTAQRLSETIRKAISTSFADPELSAQVQEATRYVISGISKGCIKELKPRLSSIYRQIAFIRACETRGLFPSPEALDDIEEQIMTIWRFFDEVQSYGNGLTSARH